MSSRVVHIATDGHFAEEATSNDIRHRQFADIEVPVEFDFGVLWRAENDGLPNLFPEFFASVVFRSLGQEQNRAGLQAEQFAFGLIFTEEDESLSEPQPMDFFIGIAFPFAGGKEFEQVGDFFTFFVVSFGNFGLSGIVAAAGIWQYEWNESPAVQEVQGENEQETGECCFGAHRAAVERSPAE